MCQFFLVLFCQALVVPQRGFPLGEGQAPSEIEMLMALPDADPDVLRQNAYEHLAEVIFGNPVAVSVALFCPFTNVICQIAHVFAWRKCMKASHPLYSALVRSPFMLKVHCSPKSKAISRFATSHGFSTEMGMIREDAAEEGVQVIREHGQVPAVESINVVLEDPVPGDGLPIDTHGVQEAPP